MPYTDHIPKLCRHRASGKAYVTLQGRQVYLGAWGSPGAREAYNRLVAEWLSAGRVMLPAQSRSGGGGITILELCAAFLPHVLQYYRHPDGTPTGESDGYKYAMRFLKNLYGQMPADEFGPQQLMAVRHKMIEAGLVRRTCNSYSRRIRRMFRWGVQQGLLRMDQYHGLCAVDGLRSGRSAAKDNDPVKPVPVEHVEQILPFLSRQVAAMVQLQLLTGARPGELCIMRACDINMTGDLWEYAPAMHKTAYRNKSRVIILGPKAMTIVRGFLGMEPKAYLFDPRQAEQERLAAKHAQRKTPLHYGNRPGTNRRKNPKRPPGERYDVASYRRAIQRGCQKAGIPSWHPHQLRHTRATELRRKFGLETARTVLGHSNLDITEIYAQQDMEKARQAMLQVG